MRKSKVVVLFVTVMIFILSGCNKEEGTEFYADGTLKGKGTVQADGQKEGKWKYFYGNGLMMSEGEYNDGHKVGKWKYWNKNGKLITVRDHKAGEGHTTEMAGAEDAIKDDAAKAAKASVEPHKAEVPKSAPHKAEAPKAETQPAATEEVTTHEAEPESSTPLAATMDEWKARAAEKKH